MWYIRVAYIKHLRKRAKIIIPPRPVASAAERAIPSACLPFAFAAAPMSPEMQKWFHKLCTLCSGRKDPGQCIVYTLCVLTMCTNVWTQNTNRYWSIPKVMACNKIGLKIKNESISKWSTKWKHASQACTMPSITSSAGELETVLTSVDGHLGCITRILDVLANGVVQAKWQFRASNCRWVSSVNFRGQKNAQLDIYDLGLVKPIG